VLPELARQIDGRVKRVVVLVPGQLEGLDLPDWFRIWPLPGAAASAVRRLIFDQLMLPLRIGRASGAVLFCSGSFAPVIKSVPTVALLRNAIYFDHDFLSTELPSRRLLYRLQGMLIGLGARGCKAVTYPSDTMRSLVEKEYPNLVDGGFVNFYGVDPRFFDARRSAPARGLPVATQTISFLYVLNYTRQKNVGFVLKALARARELKMPIRVTLTSTLTVGHPLCHDDDWSTIEQHDLIESGYLSLVGPKFGDELVELYRSADACLFPSTCESFGHPLVEAMAAGKPVVSADRPYARELCGEYALYVDPSQPESLVNVWRMWGDLMREWNPPTVEEVSTRFSWRGHVERLVEHLLGS
jgi:glycosyltransferase involved in cell wall biosynthesis